VAWPKAKGGKDQEQKSYPGSKSANFQQKGPHEFPHAARYFDRRAKARG
jgi:hypothetical protein